MIKKVKKIPKYDDGSPVVIDPGTEQSWVQKNLGLQKGVAGAGQIAGAVGGAASGIASALGIEQGKTGQIISGIGSIASNFGPVGQIIGGALQTVGAFTGGGGSVDENTGEVTESSGLTKWLGFGHSGAALRRKGNQIKNSIQAKAQTENLKADYYNNSNVVVQPNVLAAEGGIMRRPVDALVSKGELIYDPTTKKLRQVPGSKGKPNKADDVFARLYEGDVVISNSPTMIMSNGRTPAQNLMGMVDKYATGGTVKAREAIIKKVVNWLEANKTKPQEFAMYSDGSSNVSKNIKKYGYNKNMLEFAYWDKDKNDYMQSYKDWVNNLTQKDVDDIFAGKYGDMSTYKGVNKSYVPTVEEARQLMTDKKYGDWHKMSQSVMNQQKLKYGALKPELSKVGHLATLPGIPKLKTEPLKVFPPKDKKNSINFGDAAYKAASILTPLLDRETAEPVQYTMRNAKYLPVLADPTPLLQAADQSQSIGRYNFENMGGSTGAYMAYGTQLASDRAKRYADAYKWQQDTQNKLIAQNVGIYNDWDKDRVSIMNSVYDKAAANRAAARNINRQNIIAAFDNWGQVLRDNTQTKQEAYDNSVKTEMLNPLIAAVYENSDKLMPMLTQYGMNRNIRKKSNNR